MHDNTNMCQIKHPITLITQDRMCQIIIGLIILAHYTKPIVAAYL